MNGFPKLPRLRRFVGDPCAIGAAAALVAAGGFGCATVRPGAPAPSTALDPDAPQAVAVHYGGPVPILDRAEKVVKFPLRLIRLGKEEEPPSEQTVGRAATYLEEYGLTDVRVAVHDYDPRGEWRRLRENRAMSAGWKYTFGTTAWLFDATFPCRVWGGDRYNPYTRTLHLNSNEPALVLAEAAYAKNLKEGGTPGLTASTSNLPLASFWKEWRKTSEVVRYAQAEQDWDTERQAYRRLYPRVGSQIATTALPLAPIPFRLANPLFGLGGSLCGYAAGRRAEAVRKAELEKQGLPTDGAGYAAVHGVEGGVDGLSAPAVHLAGGAKEAAVEFSHASRPLR